MVGLPESSQRASQPAKPGAGTRAGDGEAWLGGRGARRALPAARRADGGRVRRCPPLCLPGFLPPEPIDSTLLDSIFKKAPACPHWSQTRTPPAARKASHSVKSLPPGVGEIPSHIAVVPSGLPGCPVFAPARKAVETPLNFAFGSFASHHALTLDLPGARESRAERRGNARDGVPHSYAPPRQEPNSFSRWSTNSPRA